MATKPDIFTTDDPYLGAEALYARYLEWSRVKDRREAQQREEFRREYDRNLGLTGAATPFNRRTGKGRRPNDPVPDNQT